MNINQLWSEYQKGIRGFISMRVNDPGNIDDLVQNIWMKVIKNFETLRDDTSVKAWMYQIANREIIDFYRKQGREVELDIESVAEEGQSLGAGRELAQCIQPFLNQLNDEQANLLRQIDLEGVNQKAYAEQRGLNYSTLKSRVQKARIDLRALFEKCCVIGLDTRGGIADFKEKSSPCKDC